MSTPALTLFDYEGAHNKDMAGSRARLIKGGSWKRQRVVVLIPAGDMLPSKVALSHWNLAFPPNNGVARILAEGMEVGDAYSTAIEQVLAHPDLSQWEFVLCLEHDNLIPSDAVLKLLQAMEEHPEFSAIAGGYFCKGPAGCYHAWGDINDHVVNYRPQPPRTDGGLLEVYGTSMGCTLFRMSMFKDQRLKRPLFKTYTGIEGQGMATQDLSFWSEARKYGYRCAVHCGVKVGHIDFTGEFGVKGMVW